MAEQPIVRISIQQSQATHYYNEQELARLAHLDITIIQEMHAVGLIPGISIASDGLPDETQYNLGDLIVMRRLYRLQRDLGVNLEGAEVITRLLDHIQMLEHELLHYQHPEH